MYQFVHRHENGVSQGASEAIAPEPSASVGLRSDLDTQLIEASFLTDQPFALLFISVDLEQLQVRQDAQTQNLNVVVKPEQCDRLLETVAQSMRLRLRAQDVMARLSATEFVIVLRSDPLEKIPQVAARLTQLFDHPFQVGHQQFHLSCNIGVSFYPDDGRDADELVKKASTAIDDVKKHATQAVRLHPSDTAHAISRRLQIEQALTQPDFEHQLTMVHQPQWDCIGNRLYGFEALIRWHHPTLGDISPQEFIPIAEEMGCIHRITQLAIAQSLALTREVMDRYDIILRPSVNVSAQEFTKFHRLYETIHQQLCAYELPGNILTIELTEHVFIQQSADVIAQMTRFRDRGICIALDDFGTGFSCLNYLLDLPLNVLKIDRTFVQNLDQDPRRRGVVQAIASMAKSLNMRCVAEGVETLAEQQCLQGFGCVLFQGNGISAPLSTPDFLDYFAASLIEPA